MLQFEHTKTQDDGGGYVTITATNTEEVGQLHKHFNFGRREPSINTLLAEAEQLKAGHLVKELKSEKQPWYVFQDRLAEPFVKPYADLFMKVTGMDLNEVTFDLTPTHPKRLQHTHITNWMKIEKGYIHYEVMDSSGDWNGKKAANRVPGNCRRHIEDDFGERPTQPEFIESHCGCYQRNPNYGRYQPPRPALKCEWFWEILIDWWKDVHATEKQKQVMAMSEACYMSLWSGKGVTRDASFLINFHGLRDYEGIRINWTDQIVKWEEFKKL